MQNRDKLDEMVTRKRPCRGNSIVLYVGLLFVAAGLLLNVWVLKALFSPDGLLEPETRQKIWVFDLSLVFLGLLIILFRSCIPVFLRRLYLFFLSKKHDLLMWSIFCGLFLLFLVTVEFILRMTGLFATWSEKNGRGVHSPYEVCSGVPWILYEDVNPLTSFAQPEFDFEVRINSEGVRDIDHSEDKPRNEYRIVALGDSFTMGQGAEFHESYPKTLERRLNLYDPSKTVRVLLGGVRGSDPVFSYQLFTRRLMKYEPDFVVLLINDGDVGDIISRGGMDRFGPDGNMKKRQPPCGYWLFLHSHFARGIMMSFLQYDHYGLRPKERSQRQEAAIDVIVDVAAALETFAKNNHFRFLLVAHPFIQSEVTTLKPLEAKCSERQIDCLDLSNFFKTNIPPGSENDYFWALDGHCNGKGYDIMARGIEQHIRKAYTGPEFPWHRTIPGDELPRNP